MQDLQIIILRTVPNPICKCFCRDTSRKKSGIRRSNVFQSTGKSVAPVQILKCNLYFHFTGGSFTRSIIILHQKAFFIRRSFTCQSLMGIEIMTEQHETFRYFQSPKFHEIKQIKTDSHQLMRSSERLLTEQKSPKWKNTERFVDYPENLQMKS